MAVQDKLGAVARDRLLEIADAEKPFVLRHGAAHRGMVDHHHTEQALLRCIVEQCAEPVRLVFPKEAVGHERGGGARRGNADQRHLAPDPQIGKGVPIGRRVLAVSRHPRPPETADLVEGAGHVGIVIEPSTPSSMI